MMSSQPGWMSRLFCALAVALILKVTAEVILGYCEYFPPNFDSEFLLGRDRYFWGVYGVAFYSHIVSGPIALFLGILLISKRLRTRHPCLHTILGRIQAINILVVLTPSGNWMSWYAIAGPIGCLGLAVLAVLTAGCTLLGWRAAVQRRFDAHRRWMSRCFLLLSSVVVLRLLGGLATVYGIEADWFNSLANWASWLMPLVVYEITAIESRDALK